MKTEKPKTKQMRTWYGINASVTIGPGFLHRAGWGGFLIPHPPVMNWLLHRYLKGNERHTLSFAHEFGHLQSAPLALLYTAVNLAVPIVTGRASLPVIILILISTHAAWEILSEIITILSGANFYRKCYERITIIPRLIFWIITASLTIAGWVIAL